MKLIFCPECLDVVKLFTHTKRTCICGASGGQYQIDGEKAVISGKAIPLGIGNTSFAEALNERPEKGLGKEFTAFVIPKNSSRIRGE